jgi:hypothetical protein
MLKRGFLGETHKFLFVNILCSPLINKDWRVIPDGGMIPFYIVVLNEL